MNRSRWWIWHSDDFNVPKWSRWKKFEIRISWFEFDSNIIWPCDLNRILWAYKKFRWESQITQFWQSELNLSNIENWIRYCFEKYGYKPFTCEIKAQLDWISSILKDQNFDWQKVSKNNIIFQDLMCFVYMELLWMFLNEQFWSKFKLTKTSESDKFSTGCDFIVEIKDWRSSWQFWIQLNFTTYRAIKENLHKRIFVEYLISNWVKFEVIDQWRLWKQIKVWDWKDIEIMSVWIDAILIQLLFIDYLKLISLNWINSQNNWQMIQSAWESAIKKYSKTKWNLGNTNIRWLNFLLWVQWTTKSALLQNLNQKNERRSKRKWDTKNR